MAAYSPACWSIRHLDCHEVWRGISVGSLPPHGPKVAEAGFTHVVLCARRYQFDPSLYPRVGVVYCPFDDDASQPFTPAVTRLIIETVNHLHKLHERGANLLITCQAGLNRSALVAALTMQSFGVVPHESVRLIRKYRSPECLFNERFERIALGLPA